MNHKINISNRLKTIGDFVKDNSSVVDVGCDHGLLSIYLYLNKKNIKVIASDINEKPLNEAKKNIEKYGLSNKIETRLSDGIKNFNNDEFDTVIISGMGGITICDILNNSKDKLINTKNIIIQSNNHIQRVRKCLARLGFCIINEKLIKDKNIFYTIIVCEKTNNKVKYKYCDLYIGPILKKCRDDVFKDYINKEIKKSEKKLNSIPKKYIIERYKIKKNLKYLRITLLNVDYRI